MFAVTMEVSREQGDHDVKERPAIRTGRAKQAKSYFASLLAMVLTFSTRPGASLSTIAL